MRCIKTGAYAYLVSHNCFVRGDVYQLPIPKVFVPETTRLGVVPGDEELDASASLGHLLMSVCSVDGDAPVMSRINLKVYAVDTWFNRQRGDGSMIVVEPGLWKWLGYEGQVLQLAIEGYGR